MLGGVETADEAHSAASVDNSRGDQPISSPPAVPSSGSESSSSSDNDDEDDDEDGEDANQSSDGHSAMDPAGEAQPEPEEQQLGQVYDKENHDLAKAFEADIVHVFTTLMDDMPNGTDSGLVTSLSGWRDLAFKIDLEDLLLGALTGRSLKMHAHSLLEGLRKKRVFFSNRPIFFVAYDFGALVVKQAISEASKSMNQYWTIFDSIAKVIFSSCLQRSSSRQSMQWNALEILRSSKYSPAPRQLSGLVDAIYQTNEAFLKSKASLQSKTVSIYPSDSDKMQGDWSDLATLGLLSEISIKRPGSISTHSWEAPVTTRNIFELRLWRPRQIHWQYLQQVIMSLAPGERQLRRGPLALEDWAPEYVPILTSPACERWRQMETTQGKILLLHGQSDTTNLDAANYIIRSYLDDMARRRSGTVRTPTVFNFEFDSTDPTRNSSTALISSLIAQMMGTWGLTISRLYETIENTFRIGSSGWTDESLIHTLIESDVFSEQSVLFLHSVDNCNIKSFLDNYRSNSKRFEHRLRIIITTKDSGSLIGPGDDWLLMDIDEILAPTTGNQLWEVKAASIARLYPFDEERGKIERALAKIASVQGGNPESILSLVQRHASWPMETTQESLDCFLDFADTCADTDTITSVLDRILRASADAELVEWAVIWLHHGLSRHLYKQDLMTLLSEWTRKKSTSSFTLPSKTSELKRDMESLLRTLVEPDKETLVLRAEIRNILATNPEDGAVYIWHNLADKAHEVIIDSVLHHLAMPSAKQSLKEGLEKGMEQYHFELNVAESSFLGELGVPLCADDMELSFRLLQTLPCHLIKAGRDVPEQEDPSEIQLWTRAYWATCNPFARGPDPTTRPWMGFLDFAAVMLGRLGDGISTRRGRYLAAAFAIPIANSDTNEAPSPPSSCPDSPSSENPAPDAQSRTSTPADTAPSLMGALFASIRASDHEAALSIAIEMQKQFSKSGDKVPWPPHLIWAAAWDNNFRLLSIFLSDGADPNARNLDDIFDPDDLLENSRRDWVSPLYAATCFGHADTVKVLLQYDADTDLRLDNSWSPSAVNMAVSHSQVVVLCLLLDHNSGELETPEKLLTLLYEASDSGVVGVMPELLERIFRKHRANDALSDAGSDDDDEQSETQSLTLSNPINSIPEGYSISPLKGACSYGWPGALKILLDMGADPSFASADDDSDTPLWQAMWHSPSLDCARLLLDHGVDPNQTTKTTPSCVDYVSRVLEDHNENQSDEFFAKMLDVLITGQNPILIDAPNSITRETPLMVAAREGSLLLVKWLLLHGADINALGHLDRSPLWYAINGSHVSVVKELLGWTPAPNLNVTERDNNMTLLSMACKSVENTEALLVAGMDVNVRNGNGPTAIDQAISDENDDVVRKLIEWNADLTITDMNGWSPLASGISWESASIVRMLVDAGADPNDAVDDENLVYLSANRPDVLRIILEFGKRVDIESRNVLGRTPLIKAASNSNPTEEAAESLRLLLRAGADVRAQEHDGDAVLHNAVRSGSVSFVKIIISCPGVKVNQWQSNGFCTPLALAGGYFNLPVIKILLDHGADANQLVEAATLRATPLISTAISYGGDRNRDSDVIDETVRFLVNVSGADVTQECPGRVFATALAAAAFGAGQKTLNFLMDEGPSVIQVPDHFGRRPIHYAAANGIENLMAVYLRDREGLVASDHGSKNILHWAAQFGNMKALSFILSKHDELGSASMVVDQPDGDGWTPLCWALRPLEASYCPNMRSEPQDYAGVVETLLLRGANPRLACYLGRGGNEVEELTPLDIARRYGSAPEVIKLLTDRLDPPDSAKSAAIEDKLEEEAGRRELDQDGSEKTNEGTEEDGNEASPTNKEVLKKYKLQPIACDICLMDVSGLAMKCHSCWDFNTCAKCVRNWVAFHDGLFVRPEDEGKSHEMIINPDYDEFEMEETPASPVTSLRPPSQSQAQDDAKDEVEISSDESDDDDGSATDEDTTENVDGPI